MRLIFTSGSREGQAIGVDGARLTIGRVDENDVALPDDKVSRRHAVIERDGSGRVVLRDLDSRNGTYVDGERLSEPRVLAGGQQLRFGDAHLRVEEEAPAKAPEAATASPRRPAWRDRIRARLGRRVALVAAAVVLVVLIAVGQLLLPGVAEHSLRSDLARYGPVRHVEIHSLPAITLLWKHADRVEVAMDSYRSEPGGHTSIADFLSDTRSTGKLDVSVGTLDAQLVTLHDVRLHKDGDALVGQALLTQQALSAALPTFVGLRPVSASQNGIEVRTTATVLGRRATVHLRVLADNGRVVVRPDGIPFGSLATITVFNDPRVYVESLGAELRGDQYRLTARANLK
jgi:hypothetical protein